MLRALRFQAKLGCQLEDAIVDSIDTAATALEAVPAARLFEEFNKMFVSGYGRACWDLLRSTALRAALFPCTPPDCTLAGLAMESTDERIHAGKPVTPGFVVAALLWSDYRARADALAESKPPVEANTAAAFAAISAQQQTISVPPSIYQFRA